MLKIASENKFKALVKVRQPNERGSFDDQSFHVMFKFIPESRRKELIEQDDMMPFLNEIVLGWEGVTDANNQAVPFSLEALKMICDYDWIKIAILNTYSKSITSLAVKEKN